MDLITRVPSDGTYSADSGAPFMAEPILGPFYGAAGDFTRAQTARWFTTRDDSNKSEYGTLLNMKASTGFPKPWTPITSYVAHGTVLNNGAMYRVARPGISASEGPGPIGTGSDIRDGSVVWNFEPNFSPANGGKINLGVFTYQDKDAGATWTAAFDHQVAGGGLKKNATTLELDLANYWGDYAIGVTGPAATALQIFTGGPHRSSAAIAIGQYSVPRDTTALVNGVTLCCGTLIGDNSVLDATGSHNGFMNIGKHAGSAFTDGSGSQISFNSYGGADTAFRAAGTMGVGLTLTDGIYTAYQIKGKGWNVAPDGSLTVPRITTSNGGLQLASYTVSRLGSLACAAGTKGSLVMLTDVSGKIAYRADIATVSGGGSETVLAFCNGRNWEMH